MFTDGPATPVRIEVLLDLLKEYPKGLKREAIYSLLQPEPLLQKGPDIAKANVHATLQLNLAEEQNSVIKLTVEHDKNKSAKENILSVADQNILSNLEVEFHLALFYAFYLGLDKKVYQLTEFKGEDWADYFNNNVFEGAVQKNQFNATKFNGLHRWMGYLGLGWYDAMGNFQANPFERLLRALPIIFSGKSKLAGDQFMVQLTEVCPELDGGEIFLQANKYRKYKKEKKQCTLGLSHALIELHEDKIIKLHCPIDSRGWNIGLAEPPRDETIKSDRITLVDYLGE